MHKRTDAGLGPVCDWRELLLDFRRMGYSYPEISAALNVPATTVKSWACGFEPNFSSGYRLVRLHMRLTAKHRFIDPDRLAIEPDVKSSRLAA